MSLILQSQIRSLLDEALNQSAKLRKGGNQAIYFCKCGHYKRKLEVSLETFKWHCWVCNAKGIYLGSLLKFFGAPYSYRERLLKLTGDLRLAMRDRKKAPVGEVILPEGFIPLSCSKNNDPEYKNAMAYLKKRGISFEDILRYNIGYCNADSDYAFHIVIPSYDAAGNLNFFVGRRYYETEGTIPFKKPQVPMELVGFESFVNYSEPVILVEAAFNAITIRRNAIPMFGKYPSRKLCEKLITNGAKKVYVCLDADAESDAIKICERMQKLGIVPYFVKLLGGKDPNEIGFEKSWECINRAEEMDFMTLLAHRLKI